MRAKFEVAAVLEKHWPQVEKCPHTNSWQLRTLGAIKRCRTREMGGHKDACTSCGQIRLSYNSCRNRHCPKCQAKQREEWIGKRNSELLPVPYFHLVFTLPGSLNQLAMHRPKQVYDALFEAAWQTLKAFGLDHKHLGATPGMIAILHTWGQTLTLHPHLHCIVPGGGLNRQGNWKTARSNGKYLFPVKAMSKVFRAKYVEKLSEKPGGLCPKLKKELFCRDWVVYAKRPFANAESVVEYLGRYTHKIAISNHRLTNVTDSTVSFTYKDYRQQGKKQEMELEAMEFIRRFSMHILPKGFVRIRHYGILSSTSKKSSIPSIRQQMPEKESGSSSKKQEARKVKMYNPKECPCCKTETMITIEIMAKRGPPNPKTLNKLKTNI